VQNDKRKFKGLHKSFGCGKSFKALELFLFSVTPFLFQRISNQPFFFFREDDHITMPAIKQFRFINLL
jgi:hypothetical protein